MLDQYVFHDMTFTWLEGMKVNSDGGTLFGPVPKAVWNRYYPANDLNQIPTVTDPILIQYQGKNYLVDTSLNPEKLNKKMRRNIGAVDDGDIKGSLVSLGLSRHDIDGVIMTHMHNDHSNGLTMYDNDELVSTYPNATIYVNEIEWNDVRHPNDRTRNTYLKENWEPIQEQVQTYKHKLEVAPGITVEHTGGHSRGHSIIRFEQEGETMIHLADLLLTYVQTNPLWVGAVDDYPMDSIKAKKKLLTETFENHYRVLFYHNPFYRVIEYSEDGKSILYGLENSREVAIPMTDKQDKAF